MISSTSVSSDGSTSLTTLPTTLPTTSSNLATLTTAPTSYSSLISSTDTTSYVIASTMTATTSLLPALPSPTTAISHALFSGPGCSNIPTLKNTFSTGVCYSGDFWCSSIAGLLPSQCPSSTLSTSLFFSCSNDSNTAQLTWYPCKGCACAAPTLTNYTSSVCYPQGSQSESYYCSRNLPLYSSTRRDVGALSPFGLQTALMVATMLFLTQW
ncbi:hypothetical protein BASA50_003739 [Batrachochytrium salamandrivorans]|uniref:CBM1 domain-containing protein n=1 Tax=Batrachochytrium salamandrivorans TaxID=1357716 RepID=A0ABQ8FL61_9FUNG|nr:hypothetical protein BASA60_006322 [Batrachochytrium salamandrivorans]KAH6579958.1 hypothetical protein BASA61_009946 [Batrachochytrium salamandrivorans]KAH6598705.1 hypothetical protein BASA50_003739 [Batrachochytrium salamandrivorans]